MFFDNLLGVVACGIVGNGVQLRTEKARCENSRFSLLPCLALRTATSIEQHA
jgi:hypothetical protein